MLNRYRDALEEAGFCIGHYWAELKLLGFGWLDVWGFGLFLSGVIGLIWWAV